MLAASQRLTHADQFRDATRKGRRTAARNVVVHCALEATPGQARVGFVVSKAVGNAVQRNLVKRRLRHLAREHYPALPSGALVVIRARSAAVSASYPELASDLERCLQQVHAG